jgi:hypothetical protein
MVNSKQSLALTRRVLGEDFTKVEIVGLRIEDNLNGECSARVTLSPKFTVRGTGVGQVDAIFSALKTHFAREYKSLKNIELTDFEVSLSRNTSRHRDGADAECVATISIKNSRGNLFEFTSPSRSLAASSALAVGQAVEFFLNSEKAFCALSRALQDAQERNRQDLVTKYTAELATITVNTSYREVDSG